MTALPRILVVDDDASLLRLLAMRLGAAGYDISTVDSGEKALGQLAAFQPQLVITDMRMEGMDGMALFEAIRNQHRGLPVIILTAHGTIPDAVEATRRGVFSYLTKPFDSTELLECVRQALRISGGPGTHDTESWRAHIHTRSPLVEELLRRVLLVAKSDASVLISGESGTGRERIAKAIHAASPRARKPFIAFNCTAIPETMVESEMFGYWRGAFSDATRDHKGLFQAAAGGTLFLHEISDLSLDFQAKLLQVLQERKVRPLGSSEDIPIDVRIISACQHNLENAIRMGEFLEELFYKLNVVPLEVPPLSARREDIPLLVEYFLQHSSAARQRGITGFAPGALEILAGAAWPGNIRQLKNVVEQAVALSTTPLVPADLVQTALQDRSGRIESLVEARDDFERRYLAQVLRLANGNVSQAARIAHRNRTEFYKLLKRHHLDPAAFRESK